jgi:hypothetical protein
MEKKKGINFVWRALPRHFLYTITCFDECIFFKIWNNFTDTGCYKVVQRHDNSTTSKTLPDYVTTHYTSPDSEISEAYVDFLFTLKTTNARIYVYYILALFESISNFKIAYSCVCNTSNKPLKKQWLMSIYSLWFQSFDSCVDDGAFVHLLRDFCHYSRFSFSKKNW